MDPKAAAKSKRSHTVHGRRAHQTPAAAAAHRQKRAADAASSGPRRRDLPSNWDRYDAEGEADEPAAAKEWTGEVAPRSKGADFGFLLEQARAQPREARDLSKPWLPSLDSPFRFVQASTSMLEAKGEEILSWCDDDKFILEDDLAPDFEVPFLSMDLHALAIQLSKVKLSQRLFIEEDILPDDLAGASKDNEVLIDIESGTSLETDAKSSQGGYNLKNIQPRRDQSHHAHASSTSSGKQTETEDEFQCIQQKVSASPKVSTQLQQSDDQEDKNVGKIMDSVLVTSYREGLKVEVASAEEELDMLLNSFSGTHLSGSSLDEPFVNSSTVHGMKISESNDKVTSTKSSKPLALSPVDDDLDNLLSETSLSLQKERFTASDVTPQPTLKSDHSIELTHIKNIDVTSVDDSVDGLLEDTSSRLNEPKQTAPALGGNNTSGGSAPHSRPSNATDDFDSWFDSL